jgi:hypothetical protein
MDRSTGYFLIVVGVIGLIGLEMANRKRETLYTVASDIGQNDKLVKTFILDKDVHSQAHATGLSDQAQLFSETLFQGNTKILEPGQEIEIMVQQPNGVGVTRIWKYKSLKKNQFKTLKFTTFLHRTADKPEDRMVVYAQPRTGSIADIELYLNEDPQLVSKLAFDPQVKRPMTLTVSII